MSITTMSRRSFVGMAGAAGAAVAASGLYQAAPAVAEEAAEPELIGAAYVNPQDYDYCSNSISDFANTTLFSPWKLGPIELSHRMVKTAAGSAAYLAGLTQELHDYYVNFAKGGVEFIWIESISALTPTLKEGEEVPAETIEFAKQLVEDCKAYGAHLGYQYYTFFLVGSNDMTAEDIAAAQDRFVDVCKLIQSYGFEGFEINAAGFNLGESFLSRTKNTRTDEYGTGSLENRARFVCELIQKIKAACGEDFIVQVLINCIEADDANIGKDSLVTTVEEGIEFAKLFEAAGADSMHLRLGPLSYHPCQFASDLYFLLNGIEGATTFGTQWNFKSHWQGQIIANHSGAGILLDVAKRYKDALSIPCGVVTYMDPAHAPDFFEAALAEGKADFYMMNRPLTVDTEYVNKLREGRVDEIAPCCRCLHCHIGGNGDNAKRGYCRVNAMTQRVFREGGPASYELPPLAGDPKKVMVVGGGPAGMEAARIAALRGNDVTLYEKKAMLGGLLPFASAVKGPHENLDQLNAYLQRQLEIAGVNVVTEAEVDAAMIEAEAPDAVILACGGQRDALDVAGANVVPIEDFMFADLGENVVVYGSNAQAFDTALWCVVHKKVVNMVTPEALADVDKQQSEHAKDFITAALGAQGMRIWPSASIKEAADGVLTIISETGVETPLPCDALINAADMLPNDALAEGLSVEVYTAGDCKAPYNIARAIQAGNDAGRAV